MILDKILSNLTGAIPKERRTQLYFRDDGSFQFRKLFVEDTFLVEKVNQNIVKGWKLLFKLQFPFDGYKALSADMVTLGYSRDIILDPYGIVSEAEKPEPGMDKLNKSWITQIAEAQLYKQRNKAKPMLLVNKITLFLGISLVIQVLALAYSVAVK